MSKGSQARLSYAFAHFFCGLVEPICCQEILQNRFKARSRTDVQIVGHLVCMFSLMLIKT